MASLLIKLGAAVIAAIALVIAVMFVIGLGPFNTRPSVAAKAIPKVQAQVAKAQTHEAAAVTQAETKTKADNAGLQQRTENHVTKIRAATSRAVPTHVPDGAFYDSVCDTQFYAGNSDCSRRGR